MRRRFLEAVIGLLVIGLVVGAVAMAVWDDDALERDAEEALRVPERLPRAVNLFNSISGFGVAEGKDPAEEGFAAVTRVNSVLALPEFSDEQKLGEKVRQAWVVSELTVEDNEDILCSPPDDDCVARLWNKRTGLRALANAHQTLLHRYRLLAEFSDFRMELRPHVQMPLPEFRSLMDIHRLWLGTQVASYFQGETGGLSAVLRDLRFLRRVLAQADDLLTKAVFAIMVVEDLHVYAALMDREGAVLDDFPELESLSAQEASLESALKSEFRFSTSVLLTVENRPEIYGHLDMPGWLRALALRPFFKPNRSMNAAYRCWQQTCAVTRLRPADVLARGPSEAETSCELGWVEWISNPIGTALVSVVQTDVGRHVIRLHDLQGLITLVNLKRSIRKAGIGEAPLPEYLSAEGARFTDPYVGKPMLWKPDTRTLYFTSPRPRGGYHSLPLQPFG